MASPGWYPDPAGQPGFFRFWNGAEWSSDLADNPYGPPPGQAAPPPPPPPPGPTAIAQPPQGYQSSAGSPAGGPGNGYGPDWSGNPQPPQPPQPPWGPSPGSRPASSSQSGSGRGVLIALIAIVVAVALGVATFFVVEALTDDDSSASGASDSPSTVASATDPDRGRWADRRAGPAGHQAPVAVTLG